LAAFCSSLRFGSDFLCEARLIVGIVASNAIRIGFTLLDRFSGMKALFEVSFYAVAIVAVVARVRIEKGSQRTAYIAWIWMNRSLDDVGMTVLARSLAMSGDMILGHIHEPRAGLRGVCGTDGRRCKQQKHGGGSPEVNSLRSRPTSGQSPKTGRPRAWEETVSQSDLRQTNSTLETTMKRSP
jgi:hypothetical protein